MARTYPSDLVDVLQRDCKTVEVDGLPILMKPVPDDPRDHVLDPRVFVNAAKASSASSSAPPSWTSLLAVRYRPLKADERLTTTDVEFSERLIDAGDHKINLFMWDPAGRRDSSAALLYIHGGGFTAGNVLQYRRALEFIAEQAGALVVFPDYRLAPETPFPGPIEDCMACCRYLFDHADELGIDADRVVIAGDSAGGSLANACMQLMPEKSFAAAVELYPLVDAGPEDPAWSYDLYPAIPEQADVARGRVDRLRGSFDVLATMYTRNRDELLDPRISADKAPDDVLAEFPPVTLITAEYDYLRFQGEQFARHLLSLGVPVRAIRYEGCDHGFFEWPGVRPQTEDVALVISDVLSGV